MRVALIHDWLTGMRGGERVLELFCNIFPDAPIFTLFHHPGSVSSKIENHPIISSRLQKIPFSRKNYRYLLPLFPGAIESFDLKGFDAVVSTSHAVAKGVITPENCLSICYCHTPMRYIWDQYDTYFTAPNVSSLTRLILPVFKDYLRNWDVSTQSRVDYFIANSRFVSDRISRLYKRHSDVIPAPVDCNYYTPNYLPPEDYYLIVSALAPYKRIDLAIEAFNESGRSLVIIGAGTNNKALKSQAKPNIEFLGRVSDEVVRDYYRRCRALIFPGVEDFGLVPLEVQACGRPVVAFASGGSLETVIEGLSGHFFHSQTSASLNEALRAFERMNFSSNIIRERSFEFDTSRITTCIIRFLNTVFSVNGLPGIPTAKSFLTC